MQHIFDLQHANIYLLKCISLNHVKNPVCLINFYHKIRRLIVIRREYAWDLSYNKAI